MNDTPGSSGVRATSVATIAAHAAPAAHGQTGVRATSVATRTVVVAAMLALAACASRGEIPETPVSHTIPPGEPAMTGAIYAAHREMALFEDQRARRVGDIITIVLQESTAAQKSASSSTSRGATASLGAPNLFGREVTRNGVPFLSGSMNSASDFAGEADAAQSNSLTGQITVTVVERLPNGNLMVQGEKWLRLSQGSEFVRISGVIRPSDIGPTNSVPSFKVADARIAYGGKGMADHATRPGLLTRFFQSPMSGQ